MFIVLIFPISNIFLFVLLILLDDVFKFLTKYGFEGKIHLEVFTSWDEVQQVMKLALCKSKHVYLCDLNETETKMAMKLGLPLFPEINEDDFFDFYSIGDYYRPKNPFGHLQIKEACERGMFNCFVAIHAIRKEEEDISSSPSSPSSPNSSSNSSPSSPNSSLNSSSSSSSSSPNSSSSSSSSSHYSELYNSFLKRFPHSQSMTERQKQLYANGVISHFDMKYPFCDLARELYSSKKADVSYAIFVVPFEEKQTNVSRSVWSDLEKWSEKDVDKRSENGVIQDTWLFSANPIPALWINLMEYNIVNAPIYTVPLYEFRNCFHV